MNKLTLIGNTTRDIELKTTTNGKTYCNFSLAVARKFDREKTDFFNCTAWEKLAELINQYVKKGNKVAIIGRMEMNEVEKDSVKTRHHSVIVEDIEFLTPKSADDTVSRGSIKDNPPVEDDDLPF